MTTLADYCLADARLVLVPIEHLTPDGMSAELAALLVARAGWSPDRVAFFDRAFALYWSRSAALARRTRTWMPPRLRHVAIVSDPASVRPYVQLLNTSSWLLYAADFDPAISHPELAAYLFAHGDRMALSGEVTLSALHNAAWWFERSDEECAAFAAAATRSPRPDADGFRALANALGWMRRLRHETLNPPLIVSPHRAIPGTGILVPQALEHEPRALVDAWTRAAHRAVEVYRTAWRGDPATPITRLVDRLAAGAPPLLVTAERGKIVWDPEHPERVGTLRSILKRADAAAVEAIDADLGVIAGHTRRFLDALVAPEALPAPVAETEQGGYSYMHRERRLIAYDLDERGMERLAGPALPYARAMLGARTVHEWAHLAVDAGWVPSTVDEGELAARQHRFAEMLTAVIAAMPSTFRRMTASDLADVGGGNAPAAGLVGIFTARLADYQSNVLARRFLEPVEMETYVRHNVRTLRAQYAPPQLFRMLVRYLYEYQYLGFSTVPDPRTYFLRSTWFDADFLETGVLDAERFAELAGAAAEICACYAVDDTRFKPIR